MNKGTHAHSRMSPETRRAIILWIVQAALGVVGYAALLFLTAGTLAWPWGWALIAVLAAFLAAHPVILIPINPELLAEREKGALAEGVKAWDKVVSMLAAGVLPVTSWIVAGLDFRFGWSSAMPVGWHLAGLTVMVLGFALFLWAMASNAYFAEGVRIQEERGHTVATSGPYRYVRHPGYVGAILSQSATPALLGSVWALIPSVGCAAMYVLRTYLEDKTLLDELPGYSEYAAETRYRLLPGVW
jgi:protein-S-isoprenylcysteine O-methyltransferase Ste14